MTALQPLLHGVGAGRAEGVRAGLAHLCMTGKMPTEAMYCPICSMSSPARGEILAGIL